MKIAALLFFSSFFISFSVSAADLVRPADSQELKNYASGIDAEYSYRQRVDEAAPVWARELMQMYRWELQPPGSHRALRNTPEDRAARDLRLRSELAWMTITGYGMLATFDFVHAEQSFAGSRSRLVLALMVSKKFWTEVRNQCIEIAELKRTPNDIKGCAERLKHDIEISQVVGSNVSLFVGGGIVLGLGKKLFQRYASKWVATRVLPLIPAFAKTKVALGVLTAGIIVVPTGFLLASASSEQETNKAFFENLQSSLDAVNVEADKASIMKMAALDLERRVIEFAIWAGPRVPKPQIDAAEYERLSKAFVVDLRFAAGFAKLAEQEAELESMRARIEGELSRIPGISAKLLALAEERKHRELSEEERKLFRSAQYLASLRLTLKLIAAAKNSN